MQKQPEIARLNNDPLFCKPLHSGKFVDDLTNMGKGISIITISEKKFEKNISRYFEHIRKTGEEIIITENHVPMLKLVPFKPKLKVEHVFKDVRGYVKYYDDILKPETDEWNEV